MSVLSCFYQWAVAEGYASGAPFSYAQAQLSSRRLTREPAVRRLLIAQELNRHSL